jgi:hypothetical protein
MIHSVTYVVCCNLVCKESGNIKKNMSKCSDCKKSLFNLTLYILNTYYCSNGNTCKTKECSYIHPTKKHLSPPYISPCIDGIHCINKNCIFLHPNQCGSWNYRV